MRYKRLIDLLVIVNARMCWLCYQGQQSASRNISKGHLAVWVSQRHYSGSSGILVDGSHLLSGFINTIFGLCFSKNMSPRTKLRRNHIQAHRANCTDCRRPRSSDHGN